jgi:hypothetical protein
MDRGEAASPVAVFSAIAAPSAFSALNAFLRDLGFLCALPLTDLPFSQFEPDEGRA